MRLANKFQCLSLLMSMVMLCACTEVTKQLPDMVFTTIHNQQIETNTLHNKVTLVSFWATSCKSCVEEMPELINTYQKYHDQGFEVLAISMEYDPPAQLVAYTTQKELPFPVIHDSYGDIAAKFDGIQATPTAFLYSKAGKQIKKTIGILNFKELHAYLDQEL